MPRHGGFRGDWVAAAYLGMGVWSLVIATISETLMGTATLWPALRLASFTYL